MHLRLGRLVVKGVGGGLIIRILWYFIAEAQSGGGGGPGIQGMESWQFRIPPTPPRLR